MPKIIHSSDWHLGARLHDQSRHQDHAHFLAWLRSTLAAQRPDALVIAGDIFDSSLPGAAAQQQYYDFLGDLAEDQSCGSVVIVAGNHDSPSLLSAPSALLRRLQVHVIGAGPAFDADKSPLILRLPSRDEIGLIIGAIPFLRERDLRQSQAGESSEEIDRNIRAGLRRYFTEVFNLAQAARQGTEPIILTAHLSLGKPELDADGSERKTYIGKLESAPMSLVPDGVDYLALGHIHKPQAVGQAHFCYSGSPLPMSFAEAGQQKRLVEVSWENGERRMRDINIPSFRLLSRLRGDWDAICRDVAALKSSLSSDTTPLWLEITVYSSTRLVDLENRIDSLLHGSPLLCLHYQQALSTEDGAPLTPSMSGQGPDLKELQPPEIFDMLLERKQIAAAQRPLLRHCFDTAVQRLAQRDQHQ